MVLIFFEFSKVKPEVAVMPIRPFRLVRATFRSSSGGVAPESNACVSDVPDIVTFLIGDVAVEVRLGLVILVVGQEKSLPFLRSQAYGDFRDYVKVPDVIQTVIRRWFVRGRFFRCRLLRRWRRLVIYFITTTDDDGA